MLIKYKILSFSCFKPNLFFQKLVYSSLLFSSSLLLKVHALCIHFPKELTNVTRSLDLPLRPCSLTSVYLHHRIPSSLLGIGSSYCAAISTHHNHSRPWYCYACARHHTCVTNKTYLSLVLETMERTRDNTTRS